MTVQEVLCWSSPSTTLGPPALLDPDAQQAKQRMIAESEIYHREGKHIFAGKSSSQRALLAKKT